MTRNRDYDYYESPGSESSQTGSDTSSSDWDSCFTKRGRPTSRYCKKSPLPPQTDNGKRKRPAESISSGDSDDDIAPRTSGKRVRHRVAQPQNNRIDLQKGIYNLDRILSPNESDGLDSEDISETDPDIDTDDTISESEDDGYADTTKENVAGMCDLWERYMKTQSGMELTPTDAWTGFVESSRRKAVLTATSSGPIQIML